MKKIITALAIFLIGCYNVYSQDEIVLTGITDDSNAKAVLFGDSGNYTVQAFMGVIGDVLMFDDNTKKRPDSIKQVQIYIMSEYLSTITSFNVVLKEGNSVTGATIKSQQVETSDLEDGWNTIDLDTPVAIDPSKNLYVGCSIAFTGSYLPIGVVEGINEEQAWVIYSGSTINLVTNATRMLLIKAVASLGDAFDNEISLLGWDKYQVVDDSLKITLKNLGKNSLTTFDLRYSIDGGTAKTKTISDINIASGESYSFILEELPVLDEKRKYTLNVTLSNPNGEADLGVNNNLSSFVYSLSSITQRVVLHEGFSSSTCGPCNYGNQVFKEVLEGEEEGTTYVSVKYQCSFPSTGDPYYTTEVGTKMTYYSINAVPTLIVDGPDNYRNVSYYYRKDIFERIADIPAFSKMSGSAEVDIPGQNVKFNVEIEPLVSSNSNLRFFAAIVEKWTEKNVKTNGETIFYNVVKKFMTSASGDPISSFKADSLIKLNFDYTFNGEYRLPANARNPINFETENSVEDFGRLKVVYWIQDYSTKEVYQAGEADPYPDGVSIPNVSSGFNASMNIYPNPLSGGMLYVDIDLEKATSGEISVYDMLGKEILRLPRTQYPAGKQTLSVNISGLPKGVYFIRLNTTEGATSKKLIITK